MESVIMRERKQNHMLDCQIAALKTDIDEKSLVKDYLINENDVNAHNERYKTGIS